MILRIDRLGVELPPPSTPDPNGAAAVQELMGGKFGEMSTLMNYTFQSFNFRFRQGALPADSHGKPWDGSFVHSSGDLVEDLTHNYFLETGARSGKLRVYEMCDHPAARALTGYLLVRGGVHQVAYARALENLTGTNMAKLFPCPRIPTAKIPECQPHIEKVEHLKLYRFSPDDFKEIVAVFNGNHPETGEPLVVEDEMPQGFPPMDL